MAKNQSGQTRYKLGCTQVPPQCNYDIGPLANLLEIRLGGNPNASQLVFNSTNLTLFDGAGCVNESLVVGIEPIAVTVLNDFKQVIANNDTRDFTNLMKGQLAVLMNTSQTCQLLAMKTSETDIPGMVNGNLSTSLLQDKVQVSFVKLSMDSDDSAVLFDQPQLGLSFSGNRLNVPAQFKNGSTILPLVNQTVPLLIMYRYEWLLDGNSEKYFLADLKN